MFKKLIEDILVKTTKIKKLLKWKFDETDWIGNICSFILSKESKLEANETLMNLTLYNISKNEKKELIKDIISGLDNYCEITSIDPVVEEELSMYFKLTKKNITYYLIISIDSVNFQRFNIIKEYLSLNPLASVLFVAVKHWAIRRNVMTTPSNYKSKSKSYFLNVILRNVGFILSHSK